MTIEVGTILIPNSSWNNPENALASAIQCLEINEQGYRFRRMNLNYNGETFFLTKQALDSSNWMLPYSPCQMRFL
jgi:hypothetical protein